MQDHGAVGEVAQPQGVALLTRPTAADLHLLHPQLPAGHTLLAEVAIQGRGGDRAAELLGQELVDRAGRAAWLLAFQLHGPCDHLLTLLAGLAAILAAAPPQSGDLLLAKPAYLAPEGRIGQPFAVAIG